MPHATMAQSEKGSIQEQSDGPGAALSATAPPPFQVGLQIEEAGGRLEMGGLGGGAPPRKKKSFKVYVSSSGIGIPMGIPIGISGKPKVIPSIHTMKTQNHAKIHAKT